MRCRIEVIANGGGGVSIWCATCHENVAWAEQSFTEEEIVATAKGHRNVMARARALRREHEIQNGGRS